MNDENLPARRVLTGDVLPVVEGRTGIPAAPLDMPFLARLRYQSEAKQVQAFTALVTARNGLLKALEEQRDLLARREIALGRLANVGALREVEALLTRHKLTQARQFVAEELIIGETRIEEMKLRLAQVRRARVEFENPTPLAPPPPPAPTLSHFERLEAVMKEIREIDALFLQMRADVVNVAGGEHNLSPNDRENLARMDMLRSVQVEALMEQLRP